MAFSFTHTRLTRTSSDLRVLSAILLPPSPILKADGLLNSSTSGEIPIFLKGTTHACDYIPTFCGPPGLHDVTKELQDKLEITKNTRDESALENWKCRESDETYNGVELQLTGRHTAPPSNSCATGGVPGELINAIRPMYYGGEVGRSSTRDDCPATRRPRAQNKYEGLWDPQASSPNATEVCNTAATPEEDLNGDQLQTMATFRTYTTLSTPMFAPPSPSSSVDVISPSSSPIGRQTHRRPLERSRAVRFAGRPKSPRLQVNDAETSLVRNAPPSPPTHEPYRLRWQLTDPAPSVPSYSCPTDRRVSDAVHPFTKQVALPDELSWLSHMIIELWIDQEGFRAVRPRMRLVGYSPRNRSLHPYESAENTGSDLTGGIAEFMPMKRETFAFHYATLDSPPVLRMVSVAGDESRDHISRQATLSVKVNGVYTVLGTETFVASIVNEDVHGSRLRWKFDYFVGDRNVDGTGKTLPGEKALTPLTFSCSPYLFHPMQGKKTGLMHIMRKNLVPKLGSQKVEPPTYPRNRSVQPQGLHHLSIGRDAAAHARSHSDASTKRGVFLPTRSPPETGARAATMNHIPRARRRRASSAGENKRRD